MFRGSAWHKSQNFCQRHACCRIMNCHCMSCSMFKACHQRIIVICLHQSQLIKFIWIYFCSKAFVHISKTLIFLAYFTFLFLHKQTSMLTFASIAWEVYFHKCSLYSQRWQCHPACMSAWQIYTSKCICQNFWINLFIFLIFFAMLFCMGLTANTWPWWFHWKIQIQQLHLYCALKLLFRGETKLGLDARDNFGIRLFFGTFIYF